MLNVTTPDRTCAPLDIVRIAPEAEGTFSVRDGLNREYSNLPADQPAEVVVAGALGVHRVLHLDPEGRLLDEAVFRVDCETEIDDEGGRFARLLDMLTDTMLKWVSTGHISYLRIHCKRYKHYVSWLRDHVHALKGMKYWDDDLKTGIELYADSQREDGMIWDKCKQMLHSSLQTWRDWEFDYGDFIRKIPGNPKRRWQRIPVENDVEFLFLEGLYYTWKACGDNEWMNGLLDNAIRAVRYATTDTDYRWSEKFQLLKRGYTIDTWDFQSEDDARRSGSIMRVLPGVTEFNVFHGDNTGMAAGCRYLAEMLTVAGREEEAAEFEQLADDLLRRLDEVSWNGEFYTHMVPENPDADRDLGDTPTDRQVTISNAYAVNRGIGHEKCANIIKSYQRIRREMPSTSPGEWYNCYPPFEKGFATIWDYMNAGVSPICAGELARGAFEHGFDDYGVDILRRVGLLGEEFGGFLPGCLRGKLPDRPEDMALQTMSLREVANVDFHGGGAEGVPGWTGGGENDMSGLPTGRKAFAGIPFDVIDPAENGRRGALGISSRPEHKQEETLAVNAKARTIYLLHSARPASVVGRLEVHYADGSHETEYIQPGQQLESWFLPAPDVVQGRPTRRGDYRIGWQGPNRKFQNVGVFTWAWANPHADKEISHLEFAAAETDAIWLIVGVTLSGAEPHLPMARMDHNIPDVWGAAAMVYALIEGLAGIVDAGVTYDTVRLAPRWPAAGVKRATACAHYPASDGYCRYRYQHDREAGTLDVFAAGSGDRIEVDLLLPDGAEPSRLLVNGEEEPVKTRTLEDSLYLLVSFTGPGAHRLEVEIG